MRSLSRSSLFVSLMLLVGLVWSPQSGETATITDINSDFTINWQLLQGQLDNDGPDPAPIDLTATAFFNITSVGRNVSNQITSVTLQITFTNTTVLSGATTEAGITSFGFGTDPDAINVLFNDSNDGGFVAAEIQNTPQQNYPGGFKEIDVCVFTQGCSGGAQQGALAAGAADTFNLSITFAGTAAEVSFSPFPVKFQTTQGSFEFADTNGGGSGGGSTVPEPSTMLLFGSGLLALGWRGRKKQLKKN